MSEKIANQIKELIIEGKIRPGELLPPERKLMEQLEVSRPSLREAIKSLIGMGLLEMSTGNRPRVTHLAAKHVVDPFKHLLDDDVNTVYDLIEVRKNIETWNAYYAAHRASEDIDIPRLEESILTMKKLMYADFNTFSSEDADFHMAIAKAAHNKIQMHMMFSIYDILKKYICTHFDKISYEEVYRQHSTIVDEIKKRNADDAQRAMLEHLNYVEARVKEDIFEKDCSDLYKAVKQY